MAAKTVLTKTIQAKKFWSSGPIVLPGSVNRVVITLAVDPKGSPAAFQLIVGSDPNGAGAKDKRGWVTGNVGATGKAASFPFIISAIPNSTYVLNINSTGSKTAYVDVSVTVEDVSSSTGTLPAPTGKTGGTPPKTPSGKGFPNPGKGTGTGKGKGGTGTGKGKGSGKGSSPGAGKGTAPGKGTPGKGNSGVGKTSPKTPTKQTGNKPEGKGLAPNPKGGGGGPAPGPSDPGPGPGPGPEDPYGWGHPGPGPAPGEPSDPGGDGEPVVFIPPGGGPGPGDPDDSGPWGPNPGPAPGDPGDDGSPGPVSPEQGHPGNPDPGDPDPGPGDPGPGDDGGGPGDPGPSDPGPGDDGGGPGDDGGDPGDDGGDPGDDGGDPGDDGGDPGDDGGDPDDLSALTGAWLTVVSDFLDVAALAALLQNKGEAKGKIESAALSAFTKRWGALAPGIGAALSLDQPPAAPAVLRAHKGKLDPARSGKGISFVYVAAHAGSGVLRFALKDTHGRERVAPAPPNGILVYRGDLRCKLLSKVAPGTLLLSGHLASPPRGKR